jgi:transcriptional regulator with XRE-family HTH domain
MVPRRFPMRLRLLRRRRGMTQATLADKAGVSRAYLSRLEIGQHDPPLSTILRLAKALRVRPGRLLD